jgi:hypothetical protein
MISCNRRKSVEYACCFELQSEMYGHTQNTNAEKVGKMFISREVAAESSDLFPSA